MWIRYKLSASIGMQIMFEILAKDQTVTSIQVYM